MLSNMANAQTAQVLIIACGALAHEIQQIKKLNSWNHIELTCLPAELHNTPDLIVGKLREKIHKARSKYSHIYIGYGDCGTGGHIDQLCEEEGIDRLPGAHCYSFFAGEAAFNEIAEQELGTLYLTDYLAQNFERIIISGFKLDKHPELREMMFSNYRRVVYLSQREAPELIEKAKQAAHYLELEFEQIHTGYGDLETSLAPELIARVQ
ncbi:MAG: DUF1638 domain-containing protein [Pseudomonadota bacterium]